MFGKEIRNARIAAGVTQTEVAKATGIPQNTISWIELDKGIPNIQQCVLLADYFGISVDELIDHETKSK
ncbi:MAG: helix-turn-helix transcriptional regulator [Clostridia bacterium]|nr:helix-turn-helix transcriptional regulator [Clostridia bacterium]